ncbi:MAG: hypothetical protein H6696_08300 [Deferribacteres bacterium]|nr:hypothetical protein [candidate division KSB1 bacterium]MCB9501923.1 hypothetical protein [Deferribacteres bacterium]
MNLSFNVPYPVAQIGNKPFAMALPALDFEARENQQALYTDEQEIVIGGNGEEISQNQVEEIDIDALVYEKARELSEENLQAPMQAVENLMAALQEKFEMDLGHLQNSAVKLAYAIAEKVVHQVAKESSQTIIAQVQEVLQNCKKELSSTLYLHPDDLKFLRENSEIISRIHDDFPALEFKASRELSRGGCKLENENGTIDATLEKQLHKISTELLQLR